ncbi:hypothetical protein DFH27DRAFT_633553 [Peziza echinospora]|nr:hypothetical protein DFH27DRAFT_633553 [Peziza echinospora]
MLDQKLQTPQEIFPDRSGSGSLTNPNESPMFPPTSSSYSFLLPIKLKNTLWAGLMKVLELVVIGAAAGHGHGDTDAASSSISGLRDPDPVVDNYSYNHGYMYNHNHPRDVFWDINPSTMEVYFREGSLGLDDKPEGLESSRRKEVLDVKCSMEERAAHLKYKVGAKQQQMYMWCRPRRDRDISMDLFHLSMRWIMPPCKNNAEHYVVLWHEDMDGDDDHDELFSSLLLYEGLVTRLSLLYVPLFPLW